MKLNYAIVGVDGDPAMLGLARSHFGVGYMRGLTLVEQDAMEFIRHHRSTYDLVVVDLFSDLEFAQEVGSREFLVAVKRSTRPGGRVLINPVEHGDDFSARSEQLVREMRHHFGTVKEKRLDGINLVFTGM